MGTCFFGNIQAVVDRNNYEERPATDIEIAEIIETIDVNLDALFLATEFRPDLSDEEDRLINTSMNFEVALSNLGKKLKTY